MKIGIIRGSFASSAEMQNFVGLSNKNEIKIFTSKNNQFWNPARMRIEKLFSPYDFVGENRILRGIYNRIFTDSHYLFGLEDRLKNFDIAHCAETYYSFTQQCLNAKNRGFIKKVISTVWENIPFNNEGIIGRVGYKKRAFKEVDLFLAVTQQAKNALLEEGCNANKIQVLMPGIDTHVFKPGKRMGRTVLYVGRDVPEKGVPDLPRSNKNFIMKIVSNTSYSRMPKIYSNADVFVLPSRDTTTWKEQYGMVLLEAMASGLPIVTTGAGAIGEVVGDAAIYSDVNNLSNTLIKLLDDKEERQRRGKMSRERALKYFDSIEFSKKLENIYENVLRQK